MILRQVLLSFPISQMRIEATESKLFSKVVQLLIRVGTKVPKLFASKKEKKNTFIVSPMKTKL